MKYSYVCLSSEMEFLSIMRICHGLALNKLAIVAAFRYFKLSWFMLSLQKLDINLVTFFF